MTMTMTKPKSQPTVSAPDHVTRLQRLETALERTLREIRILRTDMQRDASTKGVLGSRGLTGFIVEQLQAKRGTSVRPDGYSITDLMVLAERAGFAIPTRRTLTKRLTERNYRVGDIAWTGDNAGNGFWYWTNVSNDVSGGL